MDYLSDDERALLAQFEDNGGCLTVIFRNGRPRLSPRTTRTLARLIRRGRVRRAASGDFGWVMYCLKCVEPWAFRRRVGEDAADA